MFRHRTTLVRPRPPHVPRWDGDAGEIRSSRFRLTMLAALLWIGMLSLPSCGGGGRSADSGGGGQPSLLSLEPPEPYSASGLEGGSVAPSSKTYLLRNNGTADAAFASQTDHPVVSVTPSSGIVPAGEQVPVTLALDAIELDGLAVGQHTCEVQIIDGNGGGVAATIMVLLRVDPRGQGYSMNLVPARGLSAAGPAGGPMTPSQRGYSWTNNGVAPLDYVRQISQAWVTATGNDHGVVEPDQSLDFEVRLDAARVNALPPGTHRARVDLVPATMPGQPIDSIEVVVEVAPVASPITLDPAEGFVGRGLLGGPFTPNSRSYTWSNGGSSPVTYTRSVTEPWIEVTGPSSGTVGRGQQIQFDVSLDSSAASLAVGRHFGSVEFRDNQSRVIEAIEIGAIAVDPLGGATISVARSTFTTAPHHAHFSAKDSIFRTGGLEDAKIEWVAQTAGGTVVETKAGGPEFGMVFETPGEYVVTLRLLGQGDTAWSEESVPISVGAPSYLAECWLDTGAASNGNGSSGSPFNNWAAAFDFTRRNWSDGPTNEFAIHCRRGMTGTANGSWDTGVRELQGRLVIKPYGTGPKPAVSRSNGTFLYFGDDNAFALIDLDVRGALGSGMMTIRKTVHASDAPDGFNAILLRCDVRDNHGGTYWKIEEGATSAAYDAGRFDFIAIVGCTFANTSGPVVLADGGRYVLWADTNWGTWQQGFGVRHKTVQHMDARNNIHPYQPGSGSIFRIHSATAGVETRWVDISGSLFDGEDVWISPDDGNGTHSPSRHIWFHRNVVDAPNSPRAIAVFATERLVIRNNWARCNGICITHRNDARTDVATNWVIEGNSLVYQGTGASGRAVGFSPWARLSDFTFRNNLLDAPAMTSSSAYFFGVTNGESPSIIAAADGNQFSAAGGTRNWAAGFSVSGQTLATWRSNTGLDALSSDQAVADFARPTGSPLDLHIGTNSTAIDAAVPASGLFVDCNDRIRRQPGDVGSHDRDAVQR